MAENNVRSARLAQSRRLERQAEAIRKGYEAEIGNLELLNQSLTSQLIAAETQIQQLNFTMEEFERAIALATERVQTESLDIRAVLHDVMQFIRRKDFESNSKWPAVKARAMNFIERPA